MSAFTRLIAPSVGVLGVGVVYAPSEEPIKQLAAELVGPSVQGALNSALTSFGMTPIHKYDNGVSTHVKRGVGEMPSLSSH